MTTLTATNKRVQFYLNFTTENPSTALKQQRLKQLEESLEERNIMLDELFPNKQLGVVDRILYLTSGAGIVKVGADKLAEKCNVSIRTVTNAVKALKETREYIVARLIKTKGGAGKYIFVDKKHPNFREIMREVFSLSEYKIAELNAEQFAEQKSSEIIEAVGLEDKKTSSNIDNSFIKHAKDNYINDSDKDAIQGEIEQNAKNSREYVEEYASNKYQIELYKFLEGLDLPPQIEAVKSVLALRVGSNATAKTFVKATNLIIGMSLRINEGYQYENVVAAFTGGLKEAMTYNVSPKAVEDNSKKFKRRPVKFYNWINERE